MDRRPVQKSKEDFGLSAFCLWEQVGDCHPQGLGKQKGFLVGDATDSGFNLGQGPPTDIKADSLTSGSKLLLGDVEPVSQPADLLAYDVCWH